MKNRSFRLIFLVLFCLCFFYAGKCERGSSEEEQQTNLSDGSKKNSKKSPLSSSGKKKNKGKDPSPPDRTNVYEVLGITPKQNADNSLFACVAGLIPSSTEEALKIEINERFNGLGNKEKIEVYGTIEQSLKGNNLLDGYKREFFLFTQTSSEANLLLALFEPETELGRIRAQNEENAQIVGFTQAARDQLDNFNNNVRELYKPNGETNYNGDDSFTLETLENIIHSNLFIIKTLNKNGEATFHLREASNKVAYPQFAFIIKQGNRFYVFSFKSQNEGEQPLTLFQRDHLENYPPIVKQLFEQATAAQ